MPEILFAEDEYIRTDSGCVTTTTISASFKKPALNLKENEIFNHLLSQIRMRVEHCNGISKGHF